MPSSPILRLYFGGFEEESIPDKEFIQSFRKLASKTSCDDEPMWCVGGTLKVRWQRAEESIRSRAIEKTPTAKVQIMTYSIGCHLGAKAANLIQTETKHRVDALFLIVPDPKYRVCKEDIKDKAKQRHAPSAYEACRVFWNSDQNSPGKMLQETLCRLARQGVEIHLIASKQDAVAEWRDNTEILYDGTQSQVYWWFADEPASHKSSKYQVRVMDPGLPEEQIHEAMDCTITVRE